MIELADIVTRIGVSRRRLRYVLEHGLVGEVEAASEGRGVPRRFELETATALAVAGLMLDAGLRRSAARAAARLLQARPLFPDDPSILGQFSGQWIQGLEVADGRYFRWFTRSPEGRWKGHSEWEPIPDEAIHTDENALIEHVARQAVDPEATPPADYAPMLTIHLDVASIRHRLRPTDEAA